MNPAPINKLESICTHQKTHLGEDDENLPRPAWAALRVGDSRHCEEVRLSSTPKNVTARTLRHSLAKNLMDAGTLLGQAALLVGHESLDTTRIYSRQAADAGTSAKERLIKRPSKNQSMRLFWKKECSVRQKHP